MGLLSSTTGGQHMRQLVIIPMEPYKALVKKCKELAREYELLINGFVTLDGDGQKEVCIPCDEDTANTIVNFAAKHCPMHQIKRVTDTGHWPPR